MRSFYVYGVYSTCFHQTCHIFLYNNLYFFAGRRSPSSLYCSNHLNYFLNIANSVLTKLSAFMILVFNSTLVNFFKPKLSCQTVLDESLCLILGALLMSDYIFQKSTASDSFSRRFKLSLDMGSRSHLQTSMIFSNLSLFLRFIYSSFLRASCFERKKKRFLDFSHMYGLEIFFRPMPLFSPLQLRFFCKVSSLDTLTIVLKVNYAFKECSRVLLFCDLGICP